MPATNNQSSIKPAKPKATPNSGVRESEPSLPAPGTRQITSNQFDTSKWPEPHKNSLEFLEGICDKTAVRAKIRAEQAEAIQDLSEALTSVVNAVGRMLQASVDSADEDLDDLEASLRQAENQLVMFAEQVEHELANPTPNPNPSNGPTQNVQ